MEPDDFSQDNSGTYAEEAGINDDNSNSYTRDSEVDQLNSDFANFQDFSRNSPKDTGIFGGGGAGDFGLGPKSKEKDNFLNEQMVDYYTKSRGATATNPYPDSFFSRMFGVSNVNYTNILGGTDRINEINDLRARQAFGLPSLNTGKQYTANDYYIGQNTNMGEVKPIPSTTRDIMNFMPGGGIINALTGQPGLPQNDPRYQEIMNERAKSANDPTVFDRVSDYVKEVTGFGPKDSGASLAAGSVAEGQFGIPDNRTFDPFGNVQNPRAKFQSSRSVPEGYETFISPATGLEKMRKVSSVQPQGIGAIPTNQKVADLNLNDVYKYGEQAISKEGASLFNNPNLRFNFGLDKDNNPEGKLTYKTKFFG